jgi:uncharacterized membrane protein YedE/YeeE
MPTTLEAPAPAARRGTVFIEVPRPTPRRRAESLLLYVLLGACFGIALVKAEAISWFRIQEMFRFRGAHLFAVFGSSVATAGIGLRVVRRYALRTVGGDTIALPPKTWGSGIRYAAGGALFGVGWAIAGTCPGPLYALIGAGVGPAIVPLLGALVGAYAYGWLRPRLPH